MLWLVFAMLLRLSMQYRVGRVPLQLRNGIRCLATTTKATTNTVPVPFSLKDEEEQLFQNLRECIDSQESPIKVRVAGGWVRDKLLGGVVKNDIDIAVDNMTGVQFIMLLNRWSLNHGRGGIKYTVIKKNPEKSKHLETVQCNFGELFVDFVNLRTETYDENSRIPQMLLGTPQEDALRRDLTINSLFYNIHTKEVEDFTGQGLQDLQHRIIRTPLPALVTLTDDPLRVLRAIRFACRFNFTIAHDLVEACRASSVHEALETKVSGERVNAELMLMAKTPQFTRALYLLYHYGILAKILPLELVGEDVGVVKRRIFYNLGILSQLLLRHVADNGNKANQMMKVAKNVIYKDDELRKILGLLSILSGRFFEISKLPRNKLSVLAKSVQNSLKLNNKEIQAIKNAAGDCINCSNILRSFLSKEPSSPAIQETVFENLYAQPRVLSRAVAGQEVDSQTGKVSKLTLGLLVADCGDNIANVILMSCIDVVVNETMNQVSPIVFEGLVNKLAKSLIMLENDQFPKIEDNQVKEALNILLSKLDEILRQGDYLLQLVETWDLHRITSQPILLNGDELMEVFPILLTTDRRVFVEMKQIQERWQIVFPTGTKEEMIEFMKQVYSERDAG